jgi:gas vesicle protein
MQSTTHEWFFFLLGVSVGVVAALLIAPYSGEETREYLRDRVDEGRERAGEVFERGKEFVGRQTDAVTSAMGYGSKNRPEGI